MPMPDAGARYPDHLVSGAKAARAHRDQRGGNGRPDRDGQRQFRVASSTPAVGAGDAGFEPSSDDHLPAVVPV